jgi:hypothetical protein
MQEICSIPERENPLQKLKHFSVTQNFSGEKDNYYFPLPIGSIRKRKKNEVNVMEATVVIWIFRDR